MSAGGGAMKLQNKVGRMENFSKITFHVTLFSVVYIFTPISAMLNRQEIVNKAEQRNYIIEENASKNRQLKTTQDIDNWIDEQGLVNVHKIESTSICNECNIDKKVAPQKDWTILLYLAADNDLGPFAVRNIKQMANIGSTKSATVLIHLDIKTVGRKKVTRRFYVEKNKLVQVNMDDPISQKMDSGDPQTLISCFKWAKRDFPAKNYALILWNHGTGPLDPITGRIFNANELFTFNSHTNKLELDRSIGFLEYIGIVEYLSKFEQRGICWDDSTGNYLTNQKLEFALKTICQECLKGEKISVLGFDACLMNTIEIASMAKKYADLMVGSQEVVLGSGWNYQKVLFPFSEGSLTADKFAQHIVYAYDDAYHIITNDYTAAAINLDDIDKLEQNINSIALLLMESLKKQQRGTVKKALLASRDKRNCTHFDEPSYIDLHHFLSNLQRNLDQFKLTNKNDEREIKQKLQTTINTTKKTIVDIVVANKVGTNLKNAKGISIYFPEQRIHSSYKKTSFATSNYWLPFLTVFLVS